MSEKARRQFSYRLKEPVLRKSAELDRLQRENAELRSILESTLHEARQFSAIISDRSQNITQEEGLSPRAKELSENILHASGMLSARLAYTDIEINPSVVSGQVRYNSVIYKKFDKSRYLLRPLMTDRKVAIEFRGESHMSIPTLSVFDMLPFVLLHNAVKYSPPGYSVEVDFCPIGNDRLEVCISSYGPPVDEDELPYLLDREFRGRHSVSYEGQGLGLNLAKKVCDLHNAYLRVSTGDFLKHTLGGRRFQRFNITLYVERIDI